jgi:hypothetical protein
MVDRMDELKKIQTRFFHLTHSLTRKQEHGKRRDGKRGALPVQDTHHERWRHTCNITHWTHHALDDSGIRMDIQRVIGASAGALIGSLFALGFTGREIKTIFSEISPDRYVVPSVNSLIGCGGLSNSSSFREHYTGVLERFIGMSDISLSEVKQHFGVDFSSVTFDNIGGTVHILSADSHPDMKLADAVYASIALPGIFAPLSYGGFMFCDGGVVYNFPLPEAPGKDTLAVFIKPRYPSLASSTSAFNVSLLHYMKVSCLASQKIFHDRMGEGRDIAAKVVVLDNDIPSSLDFGLTADAYEKAILVGYGAVTQDVVLNADNHPSVFKDIFLFTPTDYSHLPPKQPKKRDGQNRHC